MIGQKQSVAKLEMRRRKIDETCLLDIITHTTTRCRHDSISFHGHRYAGPQHLTRASPRCCNPSCAAHNSPSNRETPRFFHRFRTIRAPTTRRSDEEEVLHPARARHQDAVTRVRRPTERSRATSMVVKHLRRLSMVSEVSRTSASCFKSSHKLNYNG